MEKLIYDFEVFKNDWLVVIHNYDTKDDFLIVNSKEELMKFHQQHQNDIYIGYNNTRYDQYIFKAILLDINPFEVSNRIIKDKEPAYSILPKNDIKMYNFDLSNKFRGLKELEGFMGMKITESSVDFNINRKLTETELEEVISYCKYDVTSTIAVYEELKEELDSHILMIKTFDLPMEYFEKTKAQLSAMVLESKKPDVKRGDEFKITIPDTVVLNKYKSVKEWYLNPSNMNYKKKLVIDICGVPTVFGFGGVHGAKPSYFNDGEFINSDVSSFYPAIMIDYDFLSRNVKDKNKYKEIRDKRIEFKKTKDPRQSPLKIILNGTYGCLKFEGSELYDPLMANNVCITGQLLLLDLIEKVEPYCELVNINTDGIFVRINSKDDREKYLEACDEWSKRTKMILEHDNYVSIRQKDVNNYTIVDSKGKCKFKGAYIKELSKIDYDLPIVNEALSEYLINNISIRDTIMSCDEFIKFQKIVKVTNKYTHAVHNNNVLKERVFRVYASLDENDGILYKVKNGDKLEKIANTPDKCFIYNDEVLAMKHVDKLDKEYYVNIAMERLDKFQNSKFNFKIDSGIKFVSNNTLEYINSLEAYDSFIDLHKELLEHCNKREIGILIKLSYFESYSNIKKLLTFTELYDKITKRKTFPINNIDPHIELYIKNHSDKTEKLYKNLNIPVILENIWNNIPDEEDDFIDKIKYEMEYLGYIESEIPLDLGVGVVKYVSKKNKSCLLKSFRNNKESWIKFAFELPNIKDIVVFKIADYKSILKNYQVVS